MIHSIFSDLPTFKPISFNPGLNVLLADKSPGANERQTRNRAGKTSFVELIHFLTGADANKGSLFRSEALEAFHFGMNFDLDGFVTTVQRTGTKPSRIRIQSDTHNWPIQPTRERDTGLSVLSNEKWRLVLGNLIFGLPGEEDQQARFSPTFRSLFAYIVRRELSDGFLAPTLQARMQQPWDQQVAISYLIGLDWTIARDLQIVREKERKLKALKDAAVDDDVLGTVIGRTAELRTQLTVTEQRANQLKQSLDNFRVLPEYREFEKQASDLTRQFLNLSDENTIDRELLAELQAATANELPPSFVDLETLYREAGVILPEGITRRFSEVQEFHESVIRNRRLYLLGEMEATQRRLTEREQTMQGLDQRRSELMNLLQAYGALEQHTVLQGEYARFEARATTLRQQFEKAEQLERLVVEQEVERNQLYLRLQRDFSEQDKVLKEAIIAFENISRSLYEQAGSLTISATDNGPDFEITIQGARSRGISQMQIFCFDMMLMQIQAAKRRGPGFLIHDSHLFDGVDERQISNALQIGARLSKELDFQYIVTMNSDDLPKTYTSGFNVDDYILPVRLTDATENGGLFGIRFN